MSITSHNFVDRSEKGGSLRAVTAQVEVVSRLRWPVILYLICVVIPIGFQVGPLAMTTLRLFLLFVTVPLMTRVLTGKCGKVILTDYLFFFHILWVAAALVVNNPNQVLQQAGSVGIEFLGGYAIGRTYIRSREDFVALSRLLIVIVLCFLPFSLHESMTGRPLIIEMIRKLPGLTSVQIVTIEGRMGLERVQSAFAHPIHYGLFCSVVFSLSFVALKGIASNSWRYLSSFLIAVSGFLALSSGALLAVILQIALILWATVFSQFRHRWWLLLALFVVAYIGIDLLSNRTPIRVFMSYATFSAHNAYWRGIIFEWGMKSVWLHPIFGIGMNDWVRPHFMYSGSMDNFWLVMAVRNGIPGFFFLAAGYILAVGRIMRLNFDVDERLILIRRAWVFTFLGLSFTLCTVHIWSNVYSFVFFMLGAGIWLLWADQRNADLDEAHDEDGTAASLHFSGITIASFDPGLNAKGPRMPPRYSRFERQQSAGQDKADP